MEIMMEKRRIVTLAEEGIPHCEITLSLPTAEGEGRAAARVRDFYRRIGEHTEALARSVLLPRARAAYERNDDPRRRFTHRPYRLSHTARLSAEGEETVVTRTLELSHRGRLLFREERGERLREDGRILPIKKQKGKQKRGKG